jgi:hypothetical protein
MKYPMGMCLKLLEGGNKYKVRHALSNEGDISCGLYLLECVDFWCSEDLGDGIEYHREGQQMWVASYHVDSQMLVETSSHFNNL